MPTANQTKIIVLPLDQQIRHDLIDAVAYTDKLANSFDRDILLNKLNFLRAEVDQYLDLKEKND